MAMSKLRGIPGERAAAPNRKPRVIEKWGRQHFLYLGTRWQHLFRADLLRRILAYIAFYNEQRGAVPLDPQGTALGRTLLFGPLATDCSLSSARLKHIRSVDVRVDVSAVIN
jgi:hypothetical protein